MKTISVLINTYNYGRFIAEAVESVLSQTRPATEIIVVDDGSTDDTAAVLEATYSENTKIKVIRQRNGGQLAAFITGFEHATGDFILMLDADDVYEPEHVAKTIGSFEAHPEIDFIFTAHRLFGDADSVHQQFPEDRALGFSLIGTLARTLWVGSVTSTLAFRRGLMLTLLPALQIHRSRWRVRADDCLVLGASLAGCQKYYLAAPTVRYRVHPNNNFYRRADTSADDYAHFLRRESLKTSLSTQFGVSPETINHVEIEFACLPHPTWTDYREYVAIVWNLSLPAWRKVKKRLQLYRHFRTHGEQARKRKA